MSLMVGNQEGSSAGSYNYAKEPWYAFDEVGPCFHIT